ISPLFNAGDWLRRGWNDMLLGFNAKRQQDLLGALGLRGGSRTLVLLFAGAALLAIGWMAWLTARGERERDPLLRAWHALEARYRRRGLGRAPHEPALVWVARIRTESGQPEANLERLAQRFEHSRYAPGVDAAGRRALIRELRRHRP